MVQFSKFRLSGFKSFVDLTEVEIGHGLNGVVGPNGCGKSNLLEALRWVMGETSAKKMRGGGMEDVIFAGTAQRPPRSAAEVSLFLDNSDQDAPHPFETVQDIQITRRIERDKGSLYKVNSKTVRARDVQMLFADTVSGANSPALVSQGKITTIINAKPHERRHILEESAGVAGLYSRRHEAELRLRAAEANLARMDDSMQTSRTQLGSLRRQAGAAQKYTDLSAQIRQLELLLIGVEWQKTQDTFKIKNTDYQTLETNIATSMTNVAQLHNSHEQIMTQLPLLRDADMKLQAKLQALRIEQDRLAQDQRDLQENLNRARAEKQQLESDIKETTDQIADIRGTIVELDAEQSEAQARLETAPQRLEDYQKELSALQARLDKTERTYQEHMNEKARIEAQGQEITAQYGTLKEKKAKSESRIADMQSSLDRLLSEKQNLGSLDTDRAQYKDHMDKLESLQSTVSKSKEKKANATAQAETCQTTLQNLNTEHRILEGDISNLQNLLNSMNAQSKSDLITHLHVDHGYEKALSRALGDLGLNASLDQSDDVYWVDIPASSHKDHADIPDNLSQSTKILSDVVKAPQALNNALKSIYVLDTDTLTQDVETLAQSLPQGCALVTKNADYYRWDGLRIKSSANAETSGLALEHKNRLILLDEQLEKLTQDLDKAQSEYDKALDAQSQHIEKLRQDTDMAVQQEQAGRSLYKALQQLETQTQQIDIRIEHAQERFQAAQAEYNEITTAYDDAAAKLEQIETLNAAAHDDKIETVQQQIQDQRALLNTQRSDYDVLRFQMNQDEERAKRIAQDRETLTSRLEKLEGKTTDLNSRIKETAQRIEKIEKNPISDSKKDAKLHEQISDLEGIAKESADQLAQSESLRADKSAALRIAESELSSHKERRAALQSEIAALQNELERLKSHISSEYQLSPMALLDKLSASYEQAQQARPSQNDAQNALIKLKHIRESMGPVNLRAETEAQEIQESLTELEREYEDLTAAIDHLRKGIAKLNKEARERMNIAFVKVNGHFQKLFTRLFNGGQAHLEMIESEDPLEAGLEIFAQPPGKALQSLSLLSGGEQTMAAIALIFAMFMTNPSPICVLDEIDAPLDDSNVDRMCDLLEDIAKQGKTRFMVITHHRMTMARMDRLYGVTMSEKGVSKLVSVDLATQQSFIEQLTA